MISNRPESERFSERSGEAVKQGTEKVRGKVHSMAEDARKRGESLFDEQKHRVAERLQHLSRALHDAADKLHEEDDDTLAEYTEIACQRIEQAADYVEDVQVNEVVDGIESFARRQPHIFIGGMFLVGLAAARFLKASSDARQQQKHDGGRIGEERWRGTSGSQSITQREQRSGVGGLSSMHGGQRFEPQHVSPGQGVTSPPPAKKSPGGSEGSSVSGTRGGQPGQSNPQQRPKGSEPGSEVDR